MTDARVRSMLGSAYKGMPHVVAEAVRTLRTMPGSHADRLMKLMRNDPQLADFSRRVRHELDGTSAD